MNWKKIPPALKELRRTLPLDRNDFRLAGTPLVVLLTLTALLLPAHGQQNVPIPQMPVATSNLQIPVPSQPAFDVYPDYAAGNAIANKLRDAPVKLYDFDRASLRDVLRFMADDAGIPFVALQESSAAESTLVTFTLRASPFRALETIAGANGIHLFFENGIWFMRPINEQELIGRIYKLKFNPQQNVTYDGDGSQSGATTSVSGGGSGSGIPDLNINLQGPTNVFKVETPEIVDQLKALLGIPTNGVSAQMAAEASVDNFGQLQPSRGFNPAGSRFIGESASKGDGGAQAIYNADSSTIYVVATRQQHQWVEGFLSSTDRPQALIGIEVKFFETTRDPKKDLGINWANTFGGDGYRVQLSGGAEATGGLDSGSLSTALNTVNNLSEAGSQIGIDQSGGGPYDFSRATGSTDNTRLDSSIRETGFSGGYSAVLAPDALDFSIQAFMDDRDTSTVQYPRVLTLNNREVVIRSVLNQPVLAATSSVTPGVGGTTTASVSYLPIGTIINVLPKTMPDDSVVLNVAITVSSIVGFEEIQGNSYPRASSRVYNAALQVDSGYTLAVGGIEEAFDENRDNGIPYLKDIPGLGELFKSKGRAQKKRNLIIFITPTVIHQRTRSSGISETPTSVLPVRPGEPNPPAFTPTGALVGGSDSLTESIAWLQRQADLINQIILESRNNQDTNIQIQSVISTIDMLIVEIQRLEDEYPEQITTLIRKEEYVLALRDKFEELLKNAQKDLRAF